MRIFGSARGAREIELEQAMARRQRHLLDLGRIPGGDDETPGIRVLANGFHDVADLVDGARVGRGPRAPLLAVNRSELAALVRPFVPDRDAVLLEVLDVGVAAQEPEQHGVSIWDE